MKILLLLVIAVPLLSETGYDAWLRYDPLEVSVAHDLYRTLPSNLVTLDDSQVCLSARGEMLRGIQGLLGKTLRLSTKPVEGDMIILGTIASARRAFPSLETPSDLISDGYWLKQTDIRKHRILLITGADDRGVLYGTFSVLRRIALHERIDQLAEKNSPFQPIRWVNQWDNLDGSIERGYAGRSIFFAGNKVLPDLTRASNYARLLASLGINGCAVNNVNANPIVLSPEFLIQLARIADVFRPWGVRLVISVPFSSPKTVGGLDTFDPDALKVKEWWRSKADEIYRLVPDLGGFLVKADSEGQLGPSTYGRNHAAAANVLADALRAHGGIVMYRAFVYDHHMDWRDLKNDRAKAAYDNFDNLDGQFADNAVLQIKHGPIDFQAREPVSPLLGALQRTNEAMELQITQEYTGQQRHLCYLVPMWKQILDFDLHSATAETPVSELVSGRVFGQRLGGLVGVSNVGLDTNWMASDLAQANLYGFGRLAWNPHLDINQITSEWTIMTWGADPLVNRTITEMELASWAVYESYTGPLGLGTLTDILHGHYGPGIESAEGNGWGQWIRADHNGIGMDRTTATGTGYIGQYAPVVAAGYESLRRCPDSLILFMHHLPYTHVLHSGKSLIQEIYDSHYDGAEQAAKLPDQWQQLRGRVDEQRYQSVLTKLQYQSGHAVVWRDAICNWFMRESGIPDAKGRVGHYPNRVEAESMRLVGYKVVDVTPWEDASGGRAISCEDARRSCMASMEFEGAPGWYTVRVQYFDTTPGNARFQISVGDQLIQEWSSSANLPWKTPNGDTSTRESIEGIWLQTGDTVRLVGIPEGSDAAFLDYVEFDRSN